MWIVPGPATVLVMGKQLGPRGPILETVLAGVLAAVVLTNLMITEPRAGVLEYGLLLVASLALLWHRRAPRIVLLVTASCVFVVFLLVGPDLIGVTPVLLAVFAAVMSGHPIPAIVASLPFVAGTAVVNSLREGALSAGWFVASGVLGEMARARQAYVEQVEQRAIEAERTREETAQRRAVEERLRIARELHDSLTHSISIVKVQAGVAVHLARKRGEAVPEALLAIQDASRDASRELRAALDVLRQPNDDASLDRLTELVDRVRSAGLTTTVAVTGTRRRLSPELDRTAYRVVQEALTNTTRHAGPASARVLVDYQPDELIVEVDDDGRADPERPPVPGTGLLGMRERVAALGGRIRAEPKPAGGFLVRAELPLDGAG
jgi:signal transduction histidine kinase